MKGRVQGVKDSRDLRGNIFKIQNSRFKIRNAGYQAIGYVLVGKLLCRLLASDFQLLPFKHWTLSVESAVAFSYGGIK